MFCQAPKDETLQRLCLRSAAELTSIFRSCTGREVYARSLKSLVRDLAGEHHLQERNALIARLQHWIIEAQSQKTTRYLKHVTNVKLLAFGSSVMGISHRDGDLDISLEGSIEDRSITLTGRLSDATRSFKADLLTEVHEILRRGQHFRQSKHTQLIRHAKVPVSKFVEPQTGIHCDLSIGNTTGVFKSVLLAEVLAMEPRLRDLVVIVKKWAKANRLNDPTNGSFNSYCLTLLVISFSQARSPPLIPPFRELFPGLRDIVCESQKDNRVDLIEEIDTFRKKAMEWRERRDRPVNEETLCELLCAFFLDLSLFATHSQLLHYTAEGVSKSNSRPTCSCWDSGFVLSAWDAKALKRYQLFVEDPFESKDNCARTLATQDWWRIVKTLQETVHLVQEFTYASPALQPEKWMVLWSFLFQNEPLPQLSAPVGISDCSIQRPKGLMVLHKECLIEHLNRFKASDKKFIAVSYSWWSKEFKQFVLSAIDSLGLFQGKGPKKKIIISKANNIKEDMVEHAVNSTLRARKTHNLVVDPYQCVMKQRLTEFLRCSIRYHKFRASYFDDETKEWLLHCVLEAGLKGKYVDGDLHLERPADLRPISISKPPANKIKIQDYEPPIVAESSPDEVVGPLELGEPSIESPANELMSFALDDDEDLDEEDFSGDANGTETCVSSCGELGTSYEMSFVQRCLATFPSMDFVKLQLDVGSEGCVRLHLVVIKSPSKKIPFKSRREELVEDLHSDSTDEAVKVTLTTTGENISIGLESCCPTPPARGLLAELATVEEETHDEECIHRPPLISDGLHIRNAEILKHVFLDLFNVMERLQDTDSFRGEIEIDPTEYVVPVSWVRQQVRDIARHLFLEIVVHNKRRRAMKIRIRKRARFEDSDTEDEGDFLRRPFQPRDAKMNLEPFFYDERRSNKNEIFERFHCGRSNGRSVDDEDHVTRCLLWIKGMKREKSMHFQSGIYPPDVMVCLRERAEELGLKLEVRDTMMYISVQSHLPNHEEGPKVSAAKLAALNGQVQAAIRNYFFKVMMESQNRGVESFGLPTKGYFMRPEWVAKQVMEIARRVGFEVKEREGTVELFATPKHGLARYFSLQDPLQIPSRPMMTGNLSRSYSGGHFPSTPGTLTSHPVALEGWNGQTSHSRTFPDDELSFHEMGAPKTENHESNLGPFGRSENLAENGSSRRPRRSSGNDRRANVREFSKPMFWENGCETKCYDRRSRGRGKGRRGRGRNNGRSVSLLNGKALPARE